MTTFDDAVRRGATTEGALALFDSLDPVPVAALFGTWRGAEFPTAHPLDGLLTASGWYGKQFIDAERVHPLLFHTADRAAAFPVDPARMPLGAALRVPVPAGGRGLRRAVLAARPLLRTARYTARLRTVEHHGVPTATMIYDAKPILDVFRRVDDTTVLGLMDLRGMARPYFFVLRRDPATRVV